MVRSWNNRWHHVGASPMGGGQGRVYIVSEDQDSDRRFALKELINPKRKERFLHEIELLRRLPPHPNVVALIDFGEDQERDSFFYVMELATGTFDQHLKDIGYSFDRSIACYLQVLMGVEHVHRHGIIHRDLKPANILLYRGDQPKIADFGLSLIADSDERLTSTSEAVGPRYYMAPELEDGRNLEVDRRADLYSLGKLLYFALSQGEMFAREKHRTERYDLSKRFLDRRYSLFAEVFNRTINEHPLMRFPDIQALSSALQRTLCAYRKHGLSEIENQVGLAKLIDDPNLLFRCTSAESISEGIHYLKGHRTEVSAAWLERAVGSAAAESAKYDLVAIIEQSVGTLDQEERLQLVRALATRDELCRAVLSSFSRGLPTRLLSSIIDRLSPAELNAIVTPIALFIHNLEDLLLGVLGRIGDLTAENAALVLVSSAKADFPQKHEFYGRLLQSYNRQRDNSERTVFEAILWGFLGSMPPSEIGQLYSLIEHLTEEDRAPCVRALGYANQVNKDLIANIKKDKVRDRAIELFLFELIPEVNRQHDSE